MKKLHSLALACLSVISITSYATAYAESRPGAVTFTLGGGYDYFSAKRHIKNAGVTYGAIGYDFTNHWGIEGLLGFFTSTSHRTIDYHRSINGTLFNVDGVYHFSSYRLFEPYVLAGVGLMDMNPNGTDANSAGNINGAIGTQIFVDKLVALRVEARDIYTWTGGKNDVLLNGGVTFYWDLC